MIQNQFSPQFCHHTFPKAFENHHVQHKKMCFSNGFFRSCPGVFSNQPRVVKHNLFVTQLHDSLVAALDGVSRYHWHNHSINAYMTKKHDKLLCFPKVSTLLFFSKTNGVGHFAYETTQQHGWIFLVSKFLLLMVEKSSEPTKRCIKKQWNQLPAV